MPRDDLVVGQGNKLWRLGPVRRRFHDNLPGVRLYSTGSSPGWPSQPDQPSGSFPAASRSLFRRSRKAMSHSSGSRIAKTDQLQELAMMGRRQKPVAGGGRSGPRRRRNLPRQSRMVSPSTVSIRRRDRARRGAIVRLRGYERPRDELLDMAGIAERVTDDLSNCRCRAARAVQAGRHRATTASATGFPQKDPKRAATDAEIGSVAPGS